MSLLKRFSFAVIFWMLILVIGFSLIFALMIIVKPGGIGVVIEGKPLGYLLTEIPSFIVVLLSGIIGGYLTKYTKRAI